MSEQPQSYEHAGRGDQISGPKADRTSLIGLLCAHLHQLRRRLITSNIAPPIHLHLPPPEEARQAAQLPLGSRYGHMDRTYRHYRL